MFKVVLPLIIIGLIALAGFFLFGAAIGAFKPEDLSISSDKKNLQKGSQFEKEQKIRFSAQFDALTESYDNTYSGHLEEVYKDTYMKARAETVEKFVKEDVRNILKFQAQVDAGLVLSVTKPQMRGKRLTVPAEIEMYQRRFVELMAEKGKFYSPYEEKEYKVIEKDKFYKGFSI